MDKKDKEIEELKKMISLLETKTISKNMISKSMNSHLKKRIKVKIKKKTIKIRIIIERSK